MSGLGRVGRALLDRLGFIVLGVLLGLVFYFAFEAPRVENASKCAASRESALEAAQRFDDASKRGDLFGARTALEVVKRGIEAGCQ